MCLIRNGSQSSLSVSASISSPGKLTHTYKDHQHTNNYNHRHTHNHSDLSHSSPDSLNGGHRTLSLVLSEDICSGRETEPWQWVWKMNPAHKLCWDESDDLITIDSNESNSKEHRYIRSNGLGHYRDAHVHSLTRRHTRRAITNTAHNENYTNKHTHAHTHAIEASVHGLTSKVLTSHTIQLINSHLAWHDKSHYKYTLLKTKFPIRTKMVLQLDKSFLYETCKSLVAST